MTQIFLVLKFKNILAAEWFIECHQLFDLLYSTYCGRLSIMENGVKSSSLFAQVKCTKIFLRRVHFLLFVDEFLETKNFICHLVHKVRFSFILVDHPFSFSSNLISARYARPSIFHCQVRSIWDMSTKIRRKTKSKLESIYASSALNRLKNFFHFTVYYFQNFSRQ